MTINITTVLKKTTTPLEETRLDNEIIIFHVNHEKYYCMNESASLLWQCLNQPMCLLSLQQQLASNLGNLPPHSQAEILEWLEDGLAKKLLEPVSVSSDQSRALSNTQLPSETQPFELSGYSAPKTSAFDIAEITRGDNENFSTDNLHLGS